MFTENIKRKIMRIAALVLSINKEDKNTCFMDLMGHVNKLTVSIHHSGWKSGEEADYHKEIYLNKNESERELDMLIAELIKIKITDKQIPATHIYKNF